MMRGIDVGRTTVRRWQGFLAVLLVLLVLGMVPSAQAQVTSGTVVAWGTWGGPPTAVPNGLTDVVAVAAGSSSYALKRDGTVVAWGYNDYGQLNLPPGLDHVAAISSGSYHGLALKDDGTVVGWGNNDYGQTNIPHGLKDVVEIAGGSVHSLALKRDGTVVAWGNNDYEQLNIPAGLRDVVAISAGGYHNLVLKRDGSVVAWGYNTSGESTVPDHLDTIVSVKAGFYHNLALTSDGTVVAWGDDSIGQTDIPAGLSDVTAISAGAHHNLALKRDGTVVVWGYDYYGQTNVPAGLSGVSAIAGGDYHNLVLIAPDTTAPETWISAQPSNPSTSGSASFSFFGSEALSTFACSLDGAAFTACTSPQSYSGVTDGSHTFRVRGTDLAGNTDASPASSTWTVELDHAAPTSQPSQLPAANSAGWNNGDVTVTWNWSDNDGGSGLDISACPTSSKSSGEDTLTLTATCRDLAGNEGNVSYPVKVDKTAPMTTGSSSTSGNGATVTLAASDTLSGVASTSYRINGGANQTYSAPFVVSGAESYTITYASTDVAGNVEATKTLNVAIAQPTNGVLDNFNRANGRPGNQWSGLTTVLFYRIADNTLDVQAGGPLVWKQNFGTAQEGFVTLKTIDTKSPSQGLLLKVQADSGPEAGAISVVYDALARMVRVSTLRLGTNGAWTIYAPKAATFANGDLLKARALANGDVQLYKNGTLITTVTLNAADKTFFNTKGGKIGIWTAASPKAVLDNFGGGTVTP